MSKSTKIVGVALPPAVVLILHGLKSEFSSQSLSDVLRKIVLTYLSLRGYSIAPELFDVSQGKRTDLNDATNLARVSAQGRKNIVKARAVMLKNREKRLLQNPASRLKIVQVSTPQKQSRHRKTA